MTKTAQRQELALTDLDAVVGGSASPIVFINPLTAQTASAAAPGLNFAPPYATPSAANNYGLADHFALNFSAMGHDSAHAADQGVAPSVPGQLSAPSAATAPAVQIDPSGVAGFAGHDVQDAQPGSWHAVDSTDNHGAPPSSLIMAIPSGLDTSSTAASSASSAMQVPAETSSALFLGLPGGTDGPADPAHGDTGHASTNDWAPASSGGGAAASSGTSW